MRRDDYETFEVYNDAPIREPRFVVRIAYDDEDIVLTSHDHPKGLEGRLIEGVVSSASSVSQSVDPLQGVATIGGFTFKTLNVADDKTRSVYDTDENDYFASTSRFKGTTRTRIRASFYRDSVSPATTECVFAVNPVLRYYVQADGTVRIYKGFDSSFDTTTFSITEGRIERVELEWDGAGNYTAYLNGESYTGTYDVRSQDGVMAIGGNASRPTSGKVWDVRVWEDDALTHDWPINEGRGHAPLDRVNGDTLTRVSVGAYPTGTWTTVQQDRVSDLLEEKLNMSPAQTLHERKVELFVGFTEDFDDFVRVLTTYTQSADYKDGEYTFRCADVTKSMRTDIFENKYFRLAVDLDDGTASPQPDISLTEAPGDYRLTHTDSFSDSPGQTVGYIKVKDTDEIIKYTGISDSPPALTGIERGLFGTTAQATSGDYSGSEENYPELEEFIYLEMPAPQLAYAVITGEVLGSSPAITLPAHWHMGVSTEKMATSEWEGVGSDLYDGDTGGIVLRFTHLKKTGGKKFVESEVHRLVGTFMPVRADGTLGIDRVNPVLTSSEYEATVTPDVITSRGELKHKQQSVINQYRIDYQYNGERFLRSFYLADAESIADNGASKTKVLQFKGLHSSRHSQSLISQLVNTLADRYRNPPEELSLNLLPRLNVVEANDILRVVDFTIQDYAGNVFLLRPFEVQRTNIDWVKGDVGVSMFASTGEAGAPLYTPQTYLADAFYTSKGTDLSSQLTADHLTSDYTLSGNDDMNAAGAVYYYDGDMTIDAGVTLTIEDNVQLRINGTLTINGTIDGAGNGHPGASDGRSVSSSITAFSVQGTPGFIGNTGASDGILRYSGNLHVTNAGAVTEGQYASFPHVAISRGDQTASPVPTDLGGIPTDLRGTSGGTGGVLATGSSFGSVLVGHGGDGGNSGAGLCIIAHNVAFGASGEIDLSGDDGAAGDVVNPFIYGINAGRAGTGAGGCPGALLIIIDGDAAHPALSGYFTADRGSTIPQGVAPSAVEEWVNGLGYRLQWNPSDPSWTQGRGLNIGYTQGTNKRILNGGDMWRSCSRITYVPESV